MFYVSYCELLVLCADCCAYLVYFGAWEVPDYPERKSNSQLLASSSQSLPDSKSDNLSDLCFPWATPTA